MKSRSVLLLGSFLLACSTILAATAERARVVLKPATGPGVQEAVFLLGARDHYAISSLKGEHCMGMPGPGSTGWWCYGFLNFRVNGEAAASNTVSSMFAAEQGRRAILDSVWHMAAADARVRFLGLPGKDFLFCEITIAPRQEVKSLDLTTLCFPAYFTGFYGQREEARFVQTPSRIIRQAENTGPSSLAPTDNWWLLYGDEFFDVAKTRESDGPCAMLVLPEDVSSIGISPPAYGITTTVAIVSGTRKIRMAFWKMKGKTNAEAADYFRINGDAIRKELAALDFTPTSVTSFDLAGITAEIERVGHSEAVGVDFQKKAADILAWIKTCFADLAAKGDGVSATERKQELLNKYSSFIYEARLAEILASLGK